MKNNAKLTSFLIGTVLLFGSCEEANTSGIARPNNIQEFAGRNWLVRENPNQALPWSNYGNHPQDIWVDDNGFLHLNVAQRQRQFNSDSSTVNVWNNAELATVESLGYGTYIFTLNTGGAVDENLEIAFFTYNAEADSVAYNQISISLNNPGVDSLSAYRLNYKVEPSMGNPEREFRPMADPANWEGVSTHSITWTDSLITYHSWGGRNTTSITADASWLFDDSNPPVTTEQGENVLIPKPSDGTKATISFALEELADAPASGTRQQIIIEDFQFLPAN
jgi:hypothetical protein